VVYVRQSSPHQVLEHRESTALQYNLAHRAVDLGWSRERVLIIDEDQGQSGRTAEGRLGFQRLLAEVGLDHVGLILGIEMSRLARSCKDWHQLLELCALFGTLLGDQDGLYDPTDYNDRLLLGLKGTMSEAELHILRGRLHQGQLNKARRGELFNHAPIGYVRLPTGEMALDPDEQVQAVVHLVFDKFEELGSEGALLRYLVRHGIRLGVRPHSGPNRGQLEWRRPCRGTLSHMLHHPIYAGAYSYGRRSTDPRRKIAGRPSTGRVVAPLEAWAVLRKDHLPAYITWERWEANQQQLAANQARAFARGAPRDGAALLGGLLRCGQCGSRMLVAYVGPHQEPRYTCQRQQLEYAQSPCQSVAGRVLDELVSQQALAILEPANLELSLRAADDLQQERERLHGHWRQRLERAGYEVQRAARQYHAVEPENRLVARELERRWEQALLDQRHVEEEYARFCREQPAALTGEERAAILALAADIPRLWHASQTSPAHRKTILGHLMEKVIVSVQGETERVDVTIHWAGGFTSQHELVRPVARYEQLSHYDRLIARLAALRDAGQTTTQIARQLNHEGWHPPKRRATFNGPMVRQLLSRNGLVRPRRYRGTAGAELPRDQWWFADLACRLDMPQPTLYTWIRRGWVVARQLPGARGRWVIQADHEELKRLRALRQHCQYRRSEPPPPNLTRPTTRHEGS
jgi:DNA invertase Pin-like site-specific DNA recombinase/uncharacterized protein YndB with AHSA1/START domain